MVSEWPETTIGDVIDTYGGEIKTGPFGTALKASEYSEEGVPLISVREVGFGRVELHSSTPRVPPAVVERLSEYVLRTGDIVFGRKGAVERSALITEQQDGWFLGSDGIRLRLPEECDPRFISYCFLSREHRVWMLQHATGTTMASLNQGIISRIPIALPSLEEQRAIAHILGTLDDKIELNRRMNETLEAMARAIFKSWFVDFAPVRAKMESCQPPGLNPKLAALFPDSFEDSELGEIPKGWAVKPISDLGEINSWTLGAKDELEMIEYIEISQVDRGNIAETTHYPRNDAPSRARRRLRHGDSALSTVRPDRRAYFLALNPGEDLIASTGFAIVTPTEVPWSLVHAGLTQPNVFDYLGRIADGGAYPAVNPVVIAELELAVPCNQELLDAFHQLVAPLYEKAAANRVEGKLLADTRNQLLPKLLSGQLRVVAAEVLDGGPG